VDILDPSWSDSTDEVNHPAMCDVNSLEFRETSKR
jgi:hypothetical protein